MLNIINYDTTLWLDINGWLITDVMDVNAQFQPTRVDFTGGHAGYQGTERNAQSGGFW